MESTTRLDLVRTRFLILSDTQGVEIASDERPSQEADVVIHCGDLTEESKLEEYLATLRLLKGLHAPLGLVIAGNHDFTMDIPSFKEKVAQARPPLDPDLVKKTYGDYGEARQLFTNATCDGIVFLDEGTYHITLANGARLSVYASPYTPSIGDMGFHYPPNQGHSFDMMEGVDLAIIHGPPLGIMDYTDAK